MEMIQYMVIPEMIPYIHIKVATEYMAEMAMIVFKVEPEIYMHLEGTAMIQ